MRKLGIIGCGRIAETAHLPALQRLGDLVEIAAIADPSEVRRQVFGDAAGVVPSRRFADYRTMLALADLDLVDIALPHALHESAVLDAAAAGVDILLEKPIAPTLEAADRMIAAVEAAGVRLCVVHNYLFRQPDALGLRFIQEGRIGQPYLVRSEGLGFGHYKGAAGFDPDWRTRPSIAGGGCLLDNAYHNIYLCRAFMQSAITSVFARVNRYVQPIAVEDTALVLFGHANGGTSSVQVSWAVRAGGQRVQEIHGTEGSIAFGRDGKPLAIFEHARGVWDYPEVEADFGFPTFMQLAIAAFADGGPLPVTAQDARQNLATVLAAYQSAGEARVVNLE